ncbi:3TM-type holin [Tenacibaculum maritimum]|uniref:3TM-type holin n=1 Tax=Tenacibaculum maritimum TaxID=107401 RepID=UPI0012E58DE6|nr:3TM-type holin [Tenacibaculum maritimum]MDB0599797.1 3TM-type holin [Tenacibaculum maritimum]MDB0610907.1 3TM-type holin [Tenacibaculum maritimum]CAA0231916.1 conserved hypothetical protein [Tenacibaculum maritimum]
MKKMWAWLTGSVFKEIGNVIDNVITNDEERLKAKEAILTMLMEKGNEIDKFKADIIQAEAKGNFLQRSWRPILMLLFGFVVLYSKFIAPAFSLPNTELEQDFWNLLQLGIGGYVVGRSAEKIIKDVSRNVDFNIRKK